jgi:hypothetical protein
LTREKVEMGGGRRERKMREGKGENWKGKKLWKSGKKGKKDD